MIWPVINAPRWWLPLVASACAALLVLVILFHAELTGARPPQGLTVPVEPLAGSGRTVHLAGTGTWLPLARVLAKAFEDSNPGNRVVVHQSIGSRGGRKAVVDGVIDIGLSTNPVDEPRSIDCCNAIVVARAAIVFAVNSTVSVKGLSNTQIVDIYSEKDIRWPNGRTIVPLLREKGDSATDITGHRFPEFAKAISAARQSRRWPTFITDDQMGQALVEVPGSLGLCDLGAIFLERQQLRPLELDDIVPGIETIQDGSYPLLQDFVMYIPRQPRRVASDFIEFVRSEQGESIILRSGGYLPLIGEPQ